jgi:hypothetical protein
VLHITTLYFTWQSQNLELRVLHPCFLPKSIYALISTVYLVGIIANYCTVVLRTLLCHILASACRIARDVAYCTVVLWDNRSAANSTNRY